MGVLREGASKNFKITGMFAIVLPSNTKEQEFF